MKIYHLPQSVKAIIFDIDGTLYTSPQYVFEQVDAQIRHFSHLRGISEDEGRKLIKEYRHKWSKEHGGKKISLGNTLTAFGITIEESIQWRNSLLDPSLYLKKDYVLLQTLTKLKEKYALVCVTNNPVQAARKTLEAVGISEVLPDIIGLDTCKKSKPSPEMLDEAIKIAKCKTDECVSIGDRYDIDLALPLEMGMGAILVDGAEDLYDLDKTLA